MSASTNIVIPNQWVPIVYTQRCRDELMKELNAPLTLLSCILTFVGSIFGFAGFFWLLYHYYCRIFLRNTTGLFICVIAYLDFFLILQYLQKALSNIPMLYGWFENHLIIFETVTIWFLITYAMLGLLLSLNTLLVVRYGPASLLESQKIPAIVICFVAPIFCYFLPIYVIAISQNINECVDLKVSKDVLLLCVLSFFIFWTLWSYLLLIRTLRKVEQEKSWVHSSFMDSRLNRLGVIVSMCILILWVPYLIRSIAFTLFSNSYYHYDEAHYFTFDLFAFISLCQRLLMPMRGYFHALSVLYIFKIPRKENEKMIWHFLLFLFLLTPIASKEKLEDKCTNSEIQEKKLESETAQAVDDLDCTIQKDTLHNVPETPVAERVFKFSRFPIESDSAGQIEEMIERALEAIVEKNEDENE